MSVDAAREVLRRFADPGQVGCLPHGDLGLALAFGRLHRAEPDGRWDRIAHQYVTRGAQRVDPGSLGLFTGLAGTAFVLRFLGDGGRRYVRATASVETLLMAGTRERLDALPAAVRLCADYDAVSGLAGIGAVLLDVPAARPLVSDLLDRLARWTAAGFHAGHFPGEDSVDLGLAHGIAGPLALFALARRVGVDCEEWVAHDLAKQLLANVVPTEYGPDLPALAPRTSPAPTRIAWCYGNIGAARALHLAGLAFGEPDWTATALALLRSGLARVDDPVAQIEDSALCHGTAGIVRVTSRISADAGHPRDLRAAHDTLLDRLLAEPAPEGVGLLDGAPGVALALLSAAGPTEGTDWDRMLLVA